MPKLVNGFGGISPRELQNLQEMLLALLIEFNEICQTHNIQYYLDGGTALGAVRHKGFIPWDDDIDILIKRSEFDRLLEVIDSELEKRENRLFPYMGREKHHHRTFARYVRTDVPHASRALVVEANYLPGIFLDIFILDPVPAEKLQKHLKVLEKSEEWYHKRLNGVVGRMRPIEYRFINFLERMLGTEYLNRRFTSKLSKYEDSEADYYVPRNGFNYAVYDADVFQEPKTGSFEGYELPIPTKPEKYLRGHYGFSWYRLPPETERYSTHYTLSSDLFTTQEFYRYYNALKWANRVHEVQAKRHTYQVHRKKHYAHKFRRIAELHAISYSALKDVRYDRQVLSRLYTNRQWRSLAEHFQDFYNEHARIRKISKQSQFPIALDKELLSISLETLALNGRLDEALKIASVYSREAIETSTADLLDEMANFEAKRQDRDFSGAVAIAERIIRTHPDMASAVAFLVQQRKMNHSLESLRHLYNDIAERVSDADSLKLELAKALERAGHDREARQAFQEIISCSDDGLLVLAAQDGLAKCRQVLVNET